MTSVCFGFFPWRIIVSILTLQVNVSGGNQDDLASRKRPFCFRCFQVNLVMIQWDDPSCWGFFLEMTHLFLFSKFCGAGDFVIFQAGSSQEKATSLPSGAFSVAFLYYMAPWSMSRHRCSNVSPEGTAMRSSRSGSQSWASRWWCSVSCRPDL